MKIETTKKQMRRGILEMCVLGIISEKEAYPSDIIKRLKKAELIVVEGTLYPLLNRLKTADLLQYNWQESTSGPPRKYYSLTEEGREFLKELKEAWGHLVNVVELTTKKSDQ
ncbi:MAG TPA: PadR family transcriptional regulator [Saprospiraceae bacterium]|nr:PadR family transcriptional regulator [Saprospiraceae bacterium]